MKPNRLLFGGTVLVSFLIATPGFATCPSVPSCPFPGNPCDIVDDGQFDNNCTTWVWGSPSYRVSHGYQAYAAEFQTASGTQPWLYQALSIGSGQTTGQVVVGIDLSTHTIGTEQLVVQIADQYGYPIETLGTISGSASSGPYTFNVSGNYAGQNIQLWLYIVNGASPGDTIFYVAHVTYWSGH